MGENEPVTIVVGVVVTKGGQHLTGLEGGASMRGARRAADADGFVLGEGGWGPRNVVAFMLSGAWPEVENGPSKEGMDDRLLEWGDDAGVNGGVHEPVFDSVEAVGEDIIVPRDAHVARYCGQHLIHLSSR